MNDRELLHQFVTQNSQPAFRRLVERHTNWLYSACLRRLHDPSLAEDATQAVFLALAQKAPSLLHEPTLSPWLHQAAKFVAANILRAKNRRARHESEAAAMTPTLTSSPPLHWHEIETDLEPALDRLPFRDRQMILLRFYEQKSHPEIAAALRISEAAAAKRLSRALDRLRSLLARKSTESASLSSAAITSLLLSHTVISAPPTLAVSAAVSTTAATLAKGAITAMAYAKLQTAAIIAAACLLITIPAAVITLHRAAPSPAPSPVLAAAMPDSSPIDDPISLYTPVIDEPLKFISTTPQNRLAYYHYLIRHGGRIPAGLMLIEQQSDRPYLSGFFNDTPQPANILLPNLLRDVVGLYPQDVEAAPTISATLVTLPGDIVISHAAPPEQNLPRIQAILTEQLHISLKLSLRDVPVKAIVFKGRWNYSRNPDAPETKLPFIEIFSSTIRPDDAPESSPQGRAKDVADAVGECIHRDVFIEADNMPPAIRYQFNDAMDSSNLTTVLNHIAEQTGLTWSEETRPVRHLFIDPAPAPPDAFAQVYSLEPGQLIKRVTDAPPEVRDPFIQKQFAGPPPPSNVPPLSQGSLCIGWSDNTIGNTGFIYSRRYTPVFLAQQILAIQAEEIEGNLAKRNIITGDIAYNERADITPDQYCAALQKILQDELNIPAVVQFRDVPRKVIVFHGRWKLTPVPGIPITNSPRGPGGLIIPCIDIYGGDQFDKDSIESGSGSGGPREIAGELASWIHPRQQVLIEAEGFPPILGFRTHNPPGELGNANSLSHDHDSVLNHITQQTALTWSEETRTVHRLFIESAK